MNDKRKKNSPFEKVNSLLVCSKKYQRKSTSNIEDKIKTESPANSPSNFFHDFERFINEVEGRFTELQKPNTKGIITPAKSTPKNNKNFKLNTKKCSVLNDSNDFVKVTDEHVNEPWNPEDFISKQVENSFEEIQFNKKSCKNEELPKRKSKKNLKDIKYVDEIRSTDFEKKLEKILFQTSNDNSEQSTVISLTEVSDRKTNALNVSQEFIIAEITNNAEHEHNDIKCEEIKIENKNDLDLFKNCIKNETENIIAGHHIEERNYFKSEETNINKKHEEEIIIIKEQAKHNKLKEKKLEDFSVIEIIVIDESQDAECLKNDQTQEEIVLKMDKSPSKDDMIIIKDDNNLRRTLIENDLQKEKEINLNWSTLSASSEDLIIEDIKHIFDTTNKSFTEKYHDSMQFLDKKIEDQINLNNTTLEESIIDDIRSIFETTNNLEKSIAEKYDTSMKLLEEKFGDQINQIENSDYLSSAISTSFEESIMDDIKNILGINNSEYSFAENYYKENMKILEENFGERSNLNKTPDCVARPTAKTFCCNDNYIKYINSEKRNFFCKKQLIGNATDTLNEKSNLNETPKRNDKNYNKIPFEKHSFNSSKKDINNSEKFCNIYNIEKSLLILNNENYLENLQDIIISVNYVLNLFFYNRF